MRILKAIYAVTRVIVPWLIVTSIRGFVWRIILFVLLLALIIPFIIRDLPLKNRFWISFLCLFCACGVYWCMRFVEIRCDPENPKMLKKYRKASFLWAFSLLAFGILPFWAAFFDGQSWIGCLIQSVIGIPFVLGGLIMLHAMQKNAKQGFLAPMPTPSDDDFRI